MENVNHNQKPVPVEVLGFQKNGQSAAVVTDGIRTRSFELYDSHEHGSLNQAIAYLESRGYSIIMDEWV